MTLLERFIPSFIFFMPFETVKYGQVFFFHLIY